MKIRYTIETRWSHGSYSGEVEIPDEGLEGLSTHEREKVIEEVVGDAVSNDVSWGWEEIT